MADSDIQQRDDVALRERTDEQKVAVNFPRAAETGVPDGPLPMGSAWRASEISEADWRVEIPAAALREFGIIAGALAEYDEPLDELTPDGFDWPATTDLMADVRARLSTGLGFVLLDRDRGGGAVRTGAHGGS